ncbi:phage protease [Pseudogemmobacter bohemicus]|uniref:phage protease n=1 Tax=Pseudogemmobacter bohemicus TaxID=2250708 RepID=UPI000DD3994E|nr:phage protease [Pseudogemmobacter bohemicus]
MNPAPFDRIATTANPDLARFGQALADLPGLPLTAKPEDILAALKERLGAEPDPAKYMPVTAVQSMLVERMQERRAITADRAGAKVDQAMRDGYLTAGMKPWALALCHSDEAAFDTFIQSAGPVFSHLQRPSHTSALPPSQIRPVAADSPVALAICEQLGLKPGSLAD